MGEREGRERGGRENEREGEGREMREGMKRERSGRYRGRKEIKIDKITFYKNGRNSHIPALKGFQCIKNYRETLI